MDAARDHSLKPFEAYLSQPADEELPERPYNGALTDLLALVEVYYALPADALRATLVSRGVDCLVDVNRLDVHQLAALAVHTHTPTWQPVCRVPRHRFSTAAPSTCGPVLVDAGL